MYETSPVLRGRREPLEEGDGSLDSSDFGARVGLEGVRGSAEVLVTPAEEYYIVQKAVGEGVGAVFKVGDIVERMDHLLRRVLRAEGWDAGSIESGLADGSLVRLNRAELLRSLDTLEAGIGITGGGDCAGIADCLSALAKGLDPDKAMLGVKYAGKGLVRDPGKFEEGLILIDPILAGDFEGRPSTPLGSSRVNPFDTKKPEQTANAVDNIGYYDFFFGTGGNDHLAVLAEIARRWPEHPVVGTFKSIDGDGVVNGEPAQMLGFASAMRDYQDAIWSIAQSAAAHEQVSVVEVFGRNCGKLAFEAARRDPGNLAELDPMARLRIEENADSVLLLVPEKPVSFGKLVEEVARRKREVGSCVVVVAEGFAPPEMKTEMSCLAHRNDLKERWLKGELPVEEIAGLIEVEDEADWRNDLKSILKDPGLADIFAKTVWETKLDAHGNNMKLAGIRHFIIEAIKRLSDISKVNESVENYEARGAMPCEYDRVMGRKVGAKMAELVNLKVTGGKAVVYLEGMDAMTQEPVVVDLVGVTDENNLNNEQLYPEEVLRRGGVFW